MSGEVTQTMLYIFDRLVHIIRNLDLLLGQVVACSQILASTMGFWSSIASALLGRL